MKLEQLNSATDGHKEISATGMKFSKAYAGGNPSITAYDSMGTRVATPPRTGAWDRPDATTMMRTNGYGTVEKKQLNCRH